MNLSKFSERLEELIFDTNKTLTEIGNELGCGEPTLSRYLSGRCLPALEIAVQLADYFQCSVDFLLGINEENDAKQFRVCPPFAARFEKLLEENGVSRYALQKKTHIAESTMRYWMRGKTQPSVESVVRIAEALDCSVDYVLGRES